MPLFGGGAYDVAKEREAVPFDEQLQALEEVVKAGKVGRGGGDEGGEGKGRKREGGLEEVVKAGKVRGGVGGYVGIKSYYYTQGEVGDEKLCSFSRRAQ